MDRRITIIGVHNTDSSDNTNLQKLTTILQHQVTPVLTESDSKMSEDNNQAIDSFETISFLATTPTSASASSSATTSTTDNNQRLSAGKGNEAPINQTIKITALDEGILKDNWHVNEFSAPSDSPKESDIQFGTSVNALDIVLKSEKNIPVVSLKVFGDGHEDKEVESAWSQINLPKKTPLVDKVLKYLMNNETPDLKVIIGEHQFSCYYTVLICYSEYFMNQQFTSEMMLPIAEVTPRAFEIIYAWMLSSNARVERDHIIEALNAATFLCIKDLEKQIWFCIESTEYFMEIEAFLLFLEVVKLQMQPSVESIMLKRITKFFLTSITTLEYLNFSPKHVAMLLASDSLGVNTEKEVLFAAFLWFNHDWPTRAAHLNEILSSVRMIYIPISYLMQLKQLTPYVAVNRIIETEEFKTHLNEAIFAKTLTYYGGNDDSFAEIYKQFNIPQCSPRLFICDTHCPYHKPNPNDQQDPIEYIDFINYLRMLQVEGQDYWELLQPVKIANYKPC